MQGEHAGKYFGVHERRMTDVFATIQDAARARDVLVLTGYACCVYCVLLPCVVLLYMSMHARMQDHLAMWW